MALVRHMLRQAVRCTARSTPTSMRGPATLVGGASRGSLRAVAPTFCRGLASVVHLPDAAAQYPRPQVQVASKAPMFTAPALVQGEIETDFTFVCPTELRAFSARVEEFKAIGCDVMAISTDTAESHLAWVTMPVELGGLGKMNIPIVADVSKAISATYGVLLEDAGIALRGLFVIDPEGVVQHSSVNNTGVARSLDETLRLVQAFQSYRENGEFCMFGWTPEDDDHADATPLDSGSTAASEEPVLASDGFHSPTIVGIDSPEEFHALTAKNRCVVAFHADWCTKCKTIMPYFEQLSVEHPELTFIDFDTGKKALHPLADELKLAVLPSFRVYDGHHQIGKEVFGHKPKPLRKLVELSKLSEAY